MKKEIQTNFRFIVLLAIVIILMIVAVVILGCKTEPVACNLGVHLGIGETCTGSACTLQDYRTDEQKLTFPKEIYRYGKEVNYTTQELRTTADNIVGGYNMIGTQETKNAVIAGADKICVTKAANSGYTWDGSVFGVHINSAPGAVYGLMTGIAGGVLPNADLATGILTQILPANAIRLAVVVAQW